jgi:Fe(3+) dicitrate transport protein
VGYAILDDWSALGGVHRGYSPVAPGQAAGVKPESSVNYEIGTRVESEALGFDGILFFNDYENMSSICSASSCGETLVDVQSNAGAANVYGVELSARYEHALPGELSLPFLSSYTFTRAEFRDRIQNPDPSFGGGDGEISPVDEVPYIPRHQFTLRFGVEHPKFDASMSLNYVDSMLEEAGSRGEVLQTDSALVVDASASYTILDSVSAYLTAQNLFDKKYIVSRRPFGARPGAPRWAQVGLKVSF